MRADLRENVLGAAILLVLVNLTFVPFLWGDRTLQESAVEAPSLFATGARSPRSAQIQAVRVLDPGAPAFQTEPSLALEHRTIEIEHTAPLWNPYSAFGMPLAADMQSQPYSPFAWIPILWNNARGWDVFVVGHLYIAGLFAFLFLRQFTGLVPALAGGVSYMYAGYLLLFVTMPQLSVEVLLPALLFGIEGLIRRASLATSLMLALLLACSVLGGMPESSVVALLVAVVYGVLRVTTGVRFRVDIRRVIAFGGLAIILSIGLCAVQLLPLAEYVPVSANTHTADPPGTVSDRFVPEELALYLAPLLHGPPQSNIFTAYSGPAGIRGFFGSAMSFFALIAVFGAVADVVARRRMRAVPADDAPVFILAAIVALFFLKRFGVWPVSLLGAFPGFSLVYFPKYGEAAIGCGMALLAGFGVARVSERRAPLHVVLPSLILPLVSLTVAAGVDRERIASLEEHRDFYFNALAASLLFLGTSAALALAARRGLINGMRASLAALALIVVELNVTYIVPLYYVINGNGSQAASALDGTGYVRFLQKHLRDGERVFGEDSVLYPDWSAAFGIPDVRALDALYPRRYLSFVRTFLQAELGAELTDRFVGGSGTEFADAMKQRFLALSSVRYVVADLKDLHHGNPALRLVYREPGASVYEFSSPLPRVAVYQRVIRAKDEPAARALLAAPSFDPRVEAIAEWDASPELAALGSVPRAPLRAGHIEAYRSRYVRASVDALGAALVVLNDTAFPGWEARVDGKPTAVIAANHLFRGVVVGAGKHVIEFRYEPRSFAIGAAISIAGCLCVALLAALVLLSHAKSLQRLRAAKRLPV